MIPVDRLDTPEPVDRAAAAILPPAGTTAQQAPGGPALALDHRCTVKILAAGPAGSSTTGVSSSVRIVHSGKATG
jgi:hypothetical protein